MLDAACINDRTALSLLNLWQRGFPLSVEPFADIGKAQSMSAQEVLQHYQQLKSAGAFSRIGGVFAPGAGGASLLAAMSVPGSALEHVAAMVSAQPGVNHNYEREHQINLWFVVTGRDTLAVERQLQNIESNCNLPVLRLPMLRPFRIDTAFDLKIKTQERPSGGTTRIAAAAVASHEQPLAALVEQGLDLCERPFNRWADQLGCEVSQIHAQLTRWLEEGALSRFGVVVRHLELGFHANAMTVFEVPEERIELCACALSHVPGVTLVYQRATAERWPFNLYCMVHGRDRLDVLQTIVSATQRAQLQSYPRHILFSRRRFKQTGARRFSASPTTNTPTQTAQEVEHAHP